MQLTHRIDGSEEFLSSSLASIDIPPLGIIRARNGSESIYLELTGDLEQMLEFE
jgi:hypothetical protein